MCYKHPICGTQSKKQYKKDLLDRKFTKEFQDLRIKQNLCDYANFVLELLSYDVTWRPTAADALKHGFLKRAAEYKNHLV